MKRPSDAEIERAIRDGHKVKTPVSARVSKMVMKDVKEMAESDDRTVSYMIEKLLLEAIKARKRASLLG